MAVVTPTDVVSVLFMKAEYHFWHWLLSISRRPLSREMGVENMHVPGCWKPTAGMWSGLLGSKVALGFWFIKHQFRNKCCSRWRYRVVFKKDSKTLFTFYSWHTAKRPLLHCFGNELQLLLACIDLLEGKRAILFLQGKSLLL